MNLFCDLQEISISICFDKIIECVLKHDSTYIGFLIHLAVDNST